MKVKIIIFLAVLLFLLFFLMIKSPKENFIQQDFHHLGLDSAMLYTSYHTIDAKNSDRKIAFPPSFLTAYLQNTTRDSLLLFGYRCSQSDTAGFFSHYQSLPAMIKNLLNQKLIGIYFYENLLIDGFLHTIYNRTDKYYVIVCNKKILNKDLSEYLSDKENSRFVPSSYRINVNIADTTLNAFFYVLLHEYFHIFDFENKLSIPFDELTDCSKNISSFVTKYWRYPTTPQETAFNNHYLIGDLYNKVSNKLIDSSFVVPIYTELSNGNFASYYSTTSYAEDVAEYLALYYITQCLKSDYTIEVYHEAENLLFYRPYENQRLLKRFGDLPKNVQSLLIK